MIDNEVIDEKNKKEINIQRLLPYAGPFIIFLGVLRLMGYYSQFGISIVNYLELSEVITSFLDIIVLLILLVIVTILQSFLHHDKSSIENSSRIRNSLITEEGTLNRFKLYLQYFKEPLIFGGVILIITIILHFVFPSVTTGIILFNSLFLFGIMVILLLKVETERKHKKNNSTENEQRTIRILFNSLIIIGIVMLISRVQVNMVKDEKHSYGTKVFLENGGLIISDSSNYYIGKTRNYIFIFHEKTKITDVIPMSKVEKLSIKKKSQNSFLPPY